MMREPSELADRVAFTPAAALFRGLSDAGPLPLPRQLLAGEARVVGFSNDLAMPHSAVSRHQGCLRDCDLLGVRPHGRPPVYFIAHPELLDLLALAETWPAVPGVAVALGAGHGDAQDKPCADRATPTSRHEETTR